MKNVSELNGDLVKSAGAAGGSRHIAEPLAVPSRLALRGPLGMTCSPCLSTVLCCSVNQGPESGPVHANCQEREFHF